MYHRALNKYGRNIVVVALLLVAGSLSAVWAFADGDEPQLSDIPPECVSHQGTPQATLHLPRSYSSTDAYIADLTASGSAGHPMPALTIISRSGGAVTVTLSPITDIQTAVNSNPPGTAFLLLHGVYRAMSVTAPKNGDSFIGQSGAVLDGAKLLSGWSRAVVGGVTYWTTVGGTPLTGICGSAGSCCINAWQDCISPQNLYFDNRDYAHASSFAAMKSGRWYYDRSGTDGGVLNNIYLLDNPRGHTVELSARYHAFIGRASNVTVKDLVIEKYAAPIQRGAVQPEGRGWVVDSNEVRLNHGTGISPENGATNVTVTNNNVHHNGQLGIGSGGLVGGLFDSNTIAYNNIDNVAPGFEAGGTKFTGSHIRISNNTVHDNQGVGLWTDGHGEYMTYDHNTSYNNYGGIRYEVSEHGTITNNTVYGNGASGSDQITYTSSDYGVISRNIVSVGVAGPYTSGSMSGGIAVDNTGREDGFKVTHVRVIHNTITFDRNAGGYLGAGLDDYASQPDVYSDPTNYFDYNTYYVPLLGNKNWYWGERPSSVRPGPNSVTWSTWQANGEDLHGSVIQGIGIEPGQRPKPRMLWRR
jgi:parallel beta-helix repeat protein